MAALHELSAVELGRAFAARELSPVEVVRAVLAHIERWEPALCAAWALDAEAARASAHSTACR
jgi:aspartyl-tRNA(Asn)/glutamyl-tRNA(Gln) amidotransferase subunit A